MTADPGAAGQPASGQVPAAEVPADARLVDVREPEGWAAGHAPGATHILLGQLGARYLEIPQDGPVYLICRSGPGPTGPHTRWLGPAGTR